MVAIPIPRKIVGWSTIVGALALAMVGATFSLASTTEVDAESVEMIPDADEQLTQSELRWCIFESARLDGEIEELDARLVWEVENYNVRSRAYQEQCSKKKFSESGQVRDRRGVDACQESLSQKARRRAGHGGPRRAGEQTRSRQGACRPRACGTGTCRRGTRPRFAMGRSRCNRPGAGALARGRVAYRRTGTGAGCRMGSGRSPGPRCRDRRSLRLLRAARRRSRNSQRCLEEGH